MKSFSGRKNILEQTVFSSLPFGLEESRELRALINEFKVNRRSKM